MKKDNFTYNKGMNKDTTPLFKPEGTYEFALNTLLGSKEGDDNAITNEEGNMECGTLPFGAFSVVGSVQLDDNKTVLFITDNVTTIVGIYNPDKCGFDNLIVSTCMSLRTDKQVDALFRIVRGCERTVYFTDGYNPYKSINIDRLEDYLADGFTSVKDANDDPTNGWNCIKMNHFPYYLAPCVEFDSIIEGNGNLQVGIYQFAVRYLDKNLNPTNWIYITNCIPIIDDSLTLNYGKIDGHEASTITFNRSISLIINDLDSNFKYIQLAAIESTNGLGVSNNVYILDKVAFGAATSINYIYGGFNPNLHQLTTIGDIITPNIIIKTVEAHEQTDNRLLLGGVTTYSEDWAELQRLSTLIDIKYITKDIEVQSDMQDSKYPLYYYDTMSYMRDEVYAQGVVYVFKNGTESPVFHIPGRAKDFTRNGVDFTSIANSFSNGHYRSNGVTNEWDSHLLTVVNDGSIQDYANEIEYSNIQHIPSNEFINCNTIPAGDCTVPPALELTVDKSVPGFLTFSLLPGVITSTINSATIRFIIADTFTSYPGVQEEIFATIINGTPTTVPCSFPFSVSNTCTVTIDILTENTCMWVSNTGAFLSSPVNNVPFVTINFVQSNNKFCQIERWKVFNTAINIDANSGYMGYYECSNANYPDIKDCSGISIWDASMYLNGEDLTGKPIRHHRFPDVALELQQPYDYTLDINSAIIKPIGIRYDITNLIANLPITLQDKIQGFYFVKGKRDIYNKTIYSKFYGYPNDSGISLASYSRTNPTKYAKLLECPISNDLLYNNSFINNGLYLKVERGFSTYKASGFNGYLEITNTGGPDDYEKYFQMFYKPETYVPNNSYHVNKKIDLTGIVPYNSSGFLRTYNLQTAMFRQKTAFVLGTTYFQAEYPYRSPRLVTDLVSDGLSFPDGGNYDPISGIGNMYYSLKTYKNVYSLLDFIVYERTHNCLAPIDNLYDSYNGDTFITISSAIKTFSNRLDSMKIRRSATQAIVFLESDVNSGLRHVEIFSDRYADKSTDILEFLSFEGENLIRDSSLIKIEFTPEVDDYREFTYSYNRDYSKLNEENIYLPLAFTYNYCDKCNTKEPYTIYWSEKAQSDAVSDNYKIILANNSTKLPSETGQITNLFIEKDNLFCHTEKALWALQTRPQELQTNEAVINVGTGEFLSIPPRRLITTPYGYGGSIDKFATIGTQFGTFYIDRHSRKIFLFGEGLKEISLQGMEQWFETEIRIKFIDQFRTLEGIEYPVRHTTDINSVGYQAIYDPRYDRMILHKRDFLIRDDISYGGLLPNTPTESGVYYQIVNTDDYVWSYFDADNETLLPISFDNTNYFENKGWTLSYDLKKECWVSFHSYQPNYMFNDNFTYFTFINDIIRTERAIWKHNVRNYQTYYDIKYNHILEIVLNNDAIQEKVFGSMQLISNSYKYSSVGDYYIQAGNTTFDKFLIYNEYQSSHIRDLIVKLSPYQSLSLAINETLIDRTDNYWRFNRFRDIAIDRNLVSEPLITDRWLDIIAEYNDNGQGYIDYVSNTNAIDVNKSPYDQSRFRDKYAVVRLYYKPEEEYKLVTDLMSVLNNPSIR